jgi:hypothetical protein
MNKDREGRNCLISCFQTQVCKPGGGADGFEQHFTSGNKRAAGQSRTTGIVDGQTGRGDQANACSIKSAVETVRSANYPRSDRSARLFSSGHNQCNLYPILIRFLFRAQGSRGYDYVAGVA